VRIAIASGKGGTGKTTVAVSLAAVLAAENVPVTYADCDVEEPNGCIFLKPEIETSRRVTLPVPEVVMQNCNGCGLCSEICRFKAIINIGRQPLTFRDLCRGCGGCSLVCPQGAIVETEREIGRIEKGRAEAIRFVQGKLRIGEAMSPPLIREVKRAIPTDGVAILDSPPGATCPMVEALRGADLVLLVAEPTPFGLHDLRIAAETVMGMALPFGVIINRYGMGDDGVEAYCLKEGIEIVQKIPDDRRIAEAYSSGGLITEALPELGPLFLEVFDATKRMLRI
jgi:MinD superfamily P-loop ATPase